MSYSFDWDIVSEGVPYVTISKAGLAFNMPAIKKLEIPNYVMVGFDECRMIIGIKGVSSANAYKNTYPFKERIKNNWVRIGCKDFIKYLEKKSGMCFSDAKRFDAEYDSEERILCIYVREDLEEDY